MSGEFAPVDQTAASIDERDLVPILQQGQWPYLMPILAGRQGRHVYPSIEIAKTDASKVKDPLVLTYQTLFTITIYARINTTAEDEGRNVDRIEREVLRLLGEGVLARGQKIFAESTAFRRKTEQRPYSIVSEARVSVRLVVPGEEGTVIGAGRTLEIGGRTLELVNAGTGSHSRGPLRAGDMVGNTVPVAGPRHASRAVEYRWRKDDHRTIESLVRMGVLVKCRQTEGVSADAPEDTPPEAETFLAIPVAQRDSVNYAGLRTVTLELEEYAFA